MLKRHIYLSVILLAALLILSGCTAISTKPGGAQPAKAADTARKPTVTVYISGQVHRPGVYQVPHGSKLSEVIAQAGGLTSIANAAAFNPEEIISDTIQIYIPTVDEQQPALKKREQPISVVRTEPQGGGSPAQSRPVQQATVYRPSVSVSDLERQMIEKVNQERTSRGLKSLTVDSNLVRTARIKSKDMIDGEYFAHESPRYGTMTELLASEGVTYHLAGENLAISGTLDQAHKGLMGSPGHRMNILNPPYNRIGIGIIEDKQRGLVITQHFAD